MLHHSSHRYGKLSYYPVTIILHADLATNGAIAPNVVDPDPFDMDPDPAFQFDADWDPAFQFDTDPDLTV
jgi:hypothetical protein